MKNHAKRVSHTPKRHIVTEYDPARPLDVFQTVCGVEVQDVEGRRAGGVVVVRSGQERGALATIANLCQNCREILQGRIGDVKAKVKPKELRG